MASRGWLLVVGISCLILAAQGNSTSTGLTTTPTSTSTPTSTKLSTQGATTAVSTSSTSSRTIGPASTSQGSTSPTTTAAPVTPTTPTTTLTTATTTTKTPATAATTTTPTTTTKTPATAATTTTTPTTATTTTKTPATATAASTATTASSNSSTAISSTTSGTTLSTSNNTTYSTPASITNSIEPTSSENPSSTEASSATAETSTPSSTVITSSSVTTTVQPTTTLLASTSTSPPKTILLINEFTYNGLFSNDTTYGDNFTVEIRRLEGDAAPNMTVVVSDLNMKCAAVVQVDSAAWNNNLAFETAPLTRANRRAVIVSLYTSVNGTNCTDVNVTGVHLLDATIVSQDPVNTPTTTIKFVPDYLSRILVAQVNRSIPQGANLSAVRCDDTRLDPGSFIIAPSTFNHKNPCDLDRNVTLKTITLNYTCDQWKHENTTKLINYFVKEVGLRCQCGFSPVYIRNATVNCTQTTTTTISWSIPKSFESEYDNVVNATDCIEIGTSEELCLARTCHNCNNSKKDDPQHKGNISVTVGVVIACIVVFLIIVAIVILYIRKKRRGILQFRMTRLDEDDDDLMMSNDTDDFVGGQEASFSNSSYTRFK